MTNFNYDDFKNKTSAEAKRMIAGTKTTTKVDPIFIDGFSSKFMDLILVYDEMHMFSKFIRPFILLYYKVKKLEFKLNFSQRTIDAKIFCISQLNKFLFYDRTCLEEVKTPDKDGVKVMASSDFIIVKQLFDTGAEYTLVMDFTKTLGYTVGERVSLYYTNYSNGDKVTSWNVFDLQYEDLIGHKVANKLIDLYLEKVVEYFEYRMDKDGFSFYKGY